MAVSGQTGGKLAELIKKAIDDGKLTSSEYDQILAVAESDGMIDLKRRSSSLSFRKCLPINQSLGYRNEPANRAAPASSLT